MTAADSVTELLEVGGEPGWVQALYQVHPLAVQALQPTGNTLEEAHVHVCCRLYWSLYESDEWRSKSRQALLKSADFFPLILNKSLSALEDVRNTIKHVRRQRLMKMCAIGECAD
jgi:hypothetical protein